MLNKDFAHLHLHTKYSFLDGAIKIENLMSKLVEFKMSSVAITDHGNMFGALDFYLTAKKYNIKPILGIEAYITGKSKYNDRVRENFHLVLLAENNIGYENIKQLSSKAFLYGKYYYPRIDKDLLYEHREGVIVSSACLGGEIAKSFLGNDHTSARNIVKDFKRILGSNNFFLEVQPNGIKEQIRYNAFIAQIAKDEGLRLNATNDCHYINRNESDAQNILMAIKQQKFYDDPTLMKHSTDDFYVRSEDEMFKLLSDDYIEGFETACEIGKRCNVEFNHDKIYLPKYSIPSNFLSDSEYLKNITLIGLKERFSKFDYKINKEEYLARLNSELDIIIRMDFSSYFLIVYDFIDWAKKNEIKVGPGRGSGAGSLVAYSLKITDIDPLPYNLLFERFLNPERISMPDFDIDFMQERRSEVIDYAIEKYGKNHVGQIATYSTLNAKSVIKDIARTLGVPFSEINKLTKPMPNLINGRKPTLNQMLKFAPDLEIKSKNNKVYERILKTSHVLEGLYRQVGTHAGGIVIGKKSLINYVPIFLGQNKELITQFDKDKVEVAGLVKFDFLGLKTLDVINFAEKLINKRIKLENQLPLSEKKRMNKIHSHSKFLNNKIDLLDVSLLRLDNPDVFKLISSGDTLGIFQIESKGFQELCQKLKPDCFEDIIAAVALYRPGPIQSGMVDDFIKRKNGLRKVKYPHPLLEDILKPSYGTIIYQEQVMQCAQILSGYSLGSADILRRAMSKKKFEEMEKQRVIFINGAEKNNINAKKASKIFDTIEKFAGYGFNKSHSAAYAMITYQTAYLKCIYPAEFMAALLSNASGDVNDVVKYIQSSRLSGINILPPDINISHKNFTVDYTSMKEKRESYACIRFGLGAIKGLGAVALENIIDVRSIVKKFNGIFHFCREVSMQKVNKGGLESIIKSGGMDGFSYPRKQLFNVINKAVKNAQSIKDDINIGQINMFNIFDDNINDFDDKKIPKEDEWSDSDKLKFERESLGIYLSGHPLTKYKKYASKVGVINISCLNKTKQNTRVKIIGVVVELKERLLKNNMIKWATLVIEDTSGQIEGLCFSGNYLLLSESLKSNECLMFHGKSIIDDYENKSLCKINIEKVDYLNNLIIKDVKLISIFILISNDDIFNKLIDDTYKILKKYKGNKKIEFVLRRESKFFVNIKCDNKFSINPSEDFFSEINTLSTSISASLIDE